MLSVWTAVPISIMKLERYPVDKMTELAGLFGVELDRLLDDYNRFLSQG